MTRRISVLESVPFFCTVIIATLLSALDVAAAQQAPIRRKSVTVISRRAAKPDPEPVHANARFADVLHIHAERVAGSAVDRRRALICRMLVMAQAAHTRDARASENDVVSLLRIIKAAHE